MRPTARHTHAVATDSKVVIIKYDGLISPKPISLLFCFNQIVSYHKNQKIILLSKMFCVSDRQLKVLQLSKVLSNDGLKVQEVLNFYRCF